MGESVGAVEGELGPQRQSGPGLLSPPGWEVGGRECGEVITPLRECVAVGG